MSGFEVACPACDGTIAFSASKCRHCGHKITQTDVEARPKGSPSDPKAFVGLALGLLFVGFIVWMLFLREPDSGELQRQAEVRADVERLKGEVARNLALLKAQCDAGRQSACVEYAELID